MTELMKMIEKLVQAPLLVAEAREMVEELDRNAGCHAMVEEVEKEITENLYPLKEGLRLYATQSWD
jgi:hypothetical protein